MRRVPLHRQGRSFYFLLFILCIPVIETDGDLPKYEEKRRFFCKQSDVGGHSAPSFILERFTPMDSLSPVKPNQTLGKTLWAIKADREVWHGELIDTWQTSNTSVPYEVGQCNELVNSSKSLQALLTSAAERETKDGKGMLVIHCNANTSDVDSTGHNHSSQVKCSRASQQQNNISTIADEGLLDIMQVFIRPTPNVYNAMAFQLHNQCSWSHESYASSEVMSFFQGNKAVQTLELDFNSSLFPSLHHNTLRERVHKLLDKRNTKYGCSQGMSKEFIAKNVRDSPLRVHSFIVKGRNSEMHGFKVEHFGDFYLSPRQTTRLHVSYQPDFKRGIGDEELQIVTSAGIVSVTLKANVPRHIQSLCQNAALMARAEKIVLHVCSLALFVVLLVFGRMLKQEGLIMSDTNQWSTARNAARLPQRAQGSSIPYHDEKRSSIYVSFDIGCAHNESKQCGLSLTKAFDGVHAAINCLVGLKLLYTSDASNARQPKMKITSKTDLHTQNDATTSPTSRMTGKRRASMHLQAHNKQPSTNYNGGALSLRSKACSMKKTVSQLDEIRILEKTEPGSPCAAHSDKENEKMKHKKKKGVSSLALGTETRSDSGKCTPLSMPSSPVVHEVLGRPVSPLTIGACTSFHKCESSIKKAATTVVSIDKDRHKGSWKHCSIENTLAIDSGCYLAKAKTNFRSEDSEASNLHASHARNFPKSINQEARSSEVKSVVKPSERNLVKVITVRNSSKGLATTRPRDAILTASATFPAPGRRSQESMAVVHEDRQHRPMVWSSSSSDLVSTSVMAPHARAPGSPLSPKSPSFSRNTLLSSLLTAPSSSRQHMQQGNLMCINRGGQRSDVKGKAQDAQEMYYYNASGRSSPHQMHEPHHAHRRQYPHHGSNSVLLYNIWGDHFADLGRRWGPYWIEKDAPVTRKPSSLPPLLQTPPFSVFSSNDPFSR